MNNEEWSCYWRNCVFLDEGLALLIVLAQAAIRKYHRLGDLNNTYLLLTVLRAGMFKIKVPTDLVLTALFLA